MNTNVIISMQINYEHYHNRWTLQWIKEIISKYTNIVVKYPYVRAGDRSCRFGHFVSSDWTLHIELTQPHRRCFSKRGYLKGCPVSEVNSRFFYFFISVNNDILHFLLFSFLFFCVLFCFLPFFLSLPLFCFVFCCVKIDALHYHPIFTLFFKQLLL